MGSIRDDEGFFDLLDGSDDEDAPSTSVRSYCAVMRLEVGSDARERVTCGNWPLCTRLSGEPSWRADEHVPPDALSQVLLQSSTAEGDGTTVAQEPIGDLWKAMDGGCRPNVTCIRTAIPSNIGPSALLQAAATVAASEPLEPLKLLTTCPGCNEPLQFEPQRSLRLQLGGRACWRLLPPECSRALPLSRSCWAACEVRAPLEMA